MGDQGDQESFYENLTRRGAEARANLEEFLYTHKNVVATVFGASLAAFLYAWWVRHYDLPTVSPVPDLDPETRSRVVNGAFYIFLLVMVVAAIGLWRAYSYKRS